MSIAPTSIDAPVDAMAGAAPPKSAAPARTSGTGWNRGTVRDSYGTVARRLISIDMTWPAPVLPGHAVWILAVMFATPGTGRVVTVLFDRARETGETPDGASASR